jgi:hypothetical protein
MSKFKKYMRNGLIVILLACFGLFSFYYWGTYSKGFRAGVVMKLSKKGKIYKTFEGQLNMEAIETSDEKIGTKVWYFSVPKKKKDVVEKLRAVSLTGERVELEYYERYWRVPWRGKTKYFVTGVRTNSE